jgi:hypothetical protein
MKQPLCVSVKKLKAAQWIDHGHCKVRQKQKEAGQSASQVVSSATLQSHPSRVRVANDSRRRSRV